MLKEENNNKEIKKVAGFLTIPKYDKEEINKNNIFFILTTPVFINFTNINTKSKINRFFIINSYNSSISLSFRSASFIFLSLSSNNSLVEEYALL